MYEYRIKVVKVIDGDTVDVDIDLGFGVWMHKERVRLYGIDTPEIRGDERPAGIVSRDRLRELILDKEVIIKTIKDRTGKYGRYLAEIYQWDGTQQNRISVNEMLITEGLAEKYIP